MTSPLNTHKPFCDMGLWESIHVLIIGQLPNGTKIDPDTVKSSLYRLVPMAEDSCTLNKGVLDDMRTLNDKEGIQEWLIKINAQKELIRKAKEILCSPPVSHAE